MTISSSKPTQFLRSSHSALGADVGLSASSAGCLLVGRTSMLLPPPRPSSSHTRISSPRVLMLTALPRGVISASEMPDVWPQRRIPRDSDRDIAVEVQRYRTRVLSGSVARRYGWL